jgi:hypothetical protein
MLSLEAIDQRLARLELLVDKMAKRSGLLPPDETHPQPLHAQVRAGAGHFDPIGTLRAELRRLGYPRSGWDVLVDRIDLNIFQAALNEYGNTVGKSDARRSVVGFRAHVLDGLEQEAA